MSNLKKFLLGAGIATVGAVGTKVAVDYFQNRQEEKVREKSLGDAQPQSKEEVAYVVVEQNSVQEFLDKTFGNPGRYVPNRPPKVFDYQDKQYMVIWAKDNQLNKNQMLAFLYTEQGRNMIASLVITVMAQIII
jgi:hypothetical protein